MSGSKLQTITLDGNILAISQANGIIKFWDTAEFPFGRLIHEFQPAEHLQAQTTCLQFSKVNKASEQKSGELNELLAIGNVTGSILIYNLKEQTIVATLKHSNKSAVTDLLWMSSSDLVSLARDSTLIFWEVPSGKKRRTVSVKGWSSLCLLGPKFFVLAGIELMLLRTPNLHINTVHTYPGHITDVIKLEPVILQSQVCARYFLSVSRDSKFIYAWCTDVKEAEGLNKPANSFNAKDTINTISCHQLTETSVGIVVTTMKGYLKYFMNHFNGITNKNMKPMKPKSELRINCKDTGEIIPILGSFFLSSEMILIIYGTQLYLKCERITVESIADNSSMIRTNPSLMKSKKMSGLLNIVSSHISKNMSTVSQSNAEILEVPRSSKRKRQQELYDEVHIEAATEKTMEDRLNKMCLYRDASGPVTESSAHLLSQAISSNDVNKILSVLHKGNDDKFVKNTVRGLNPSSALLFLTRLSGIFNGGRTKKLDRSSLCIMWMKATLIQHMSHLSQTSAQLAVLGKIYGYISTMSNSLPRVSLLDEAISSVVKKQSTHDNRGHNNYNALIVYQDGEEIDP